MLIFADLPVLPTPFHLIPNLSRNVGSSFIGPCPLLPSPDSRMTAQTQHQLTRMTAPWPQASATSTNLSEAQRNLSNPSEPRRTSSKLSKPQQTPANLSKPQRTSANLSESQRNSANLSETQRTSATFAYLRFRCQFDSSSFVVSNRFWVRWPWLRAAGMRAPNAWWMLKKDCRFSGRETPTPSCRSGVDHRVPIQQPVGADRITEISAL